MPTFSLRHPYFIIVLCLLAVLPTVYGQSVTGQISGTVADSAGAVIPGAVVQLTNDLSKQIHTFTADSNGSFVFANLVPGSYSIRITQPGFKVYALSAITVATGDASPWKTL